MEKKVAREHIDRGFGFPVVLRNVPMVKVRGEWTPNIDYNDLTEEVLRLLANHEGRLTGNQINFIRLHFEMTLQEFGERFQVSHVAVLNWEKTGNTPTDMYWATEKDIRLFVFQRLEEPLKSFYKLYEELEEISSNKAVRIALDADAVAA